MTLHPQDTVDSEEPAPGRVALISDVHGNLPAFRAVVEDIRAAGVEKIWCLGDLVGYGAEPDGCVELAREECDVCLAGNHDLVVIEKLSIAEFSSAAAAAARWTQEHIAEASVAFLSALEPAEPAGQVGLFHASPRDPVWEYVLSSWQADECLDQMEARVGAVGHSHVALFFQRGEGRETVGAQAPADTALDVSSGRWLLNPGGVGQPRDGDPRAAWLLLDLSDWTAVWNRVEYPIDEAARAIQDAGLPSVLADRLYTGQ